MIHSGLVIDGPNKGEYIEHDKPFIELSDHPYIPREVEIHTYYHSQMQLGLDNEVSFNLWSLKSEPRVKYVMKQILEVFTRYYELKQKYPNI